MTIKSLLLCLFLYVCLVWVGAAYLRPNDITQYGLLWTGIGLIAVLVFIIVSRVFGWWRLWRAKAAARPAAPARPAPSLHPDDEAMATLLAETNAALVKAPPFAGKRAKSPVSTLPLYLLVGPEASGKTSTFLNSGLESQLLAGQGVTPVAPTRLANLWLARNAIFAELGGRAFAGDLNRWSQLLATLGRRATLPFWRRLWGETEEQMDLRGVIAFCDSKEFTGAASDPQRLERYSRDWQERLRSIAEQFGAEFPVYVVITNCDKIPFFSDFFRRLPESENNQVFGCTLPTHRPQGSSTNEVFVEAEAKRLTASFRPLYHALARRRLAHLAHEPNPAYRPGVYEFPRELKRIRSPLVQFLTDVFRPYSLGPTPMLRGYYLTGVRETELGVNEAAARPAESHAPMEATRLFRGDATQIFQGDDATKLPSPGRRALGLRWMFVAELFHKVLLSDQSRRRVQPYVSTVGRYRQLVFGAVCGLCALLCLAFLVSWIRNRELLSDVSGAIANQTDRQGRATAVADLQALDQLRAQIVRLESRLPWWFHWGLYSGDQALAEARDAYFHQFGRLLLFDMNGQMAADLESLPGSPGEADLYEPVHRLLKGYLMITSGSCTADSGFVSQVLKEDRARIAQGAAPDWQALADRQIDFYAAELAQGIPWRLTENADAIQRGRQYLRQAKGIERIYSAIRADAEQKLGKGTHLSDLAGNYTLVMNGPDAVSPIFSREGWAYVEKASKEAPPAIGEPCVLGGALATMSDWKQSAETAQAIQRLYFKDYVEAWRKFVEGFSVTKYNGAADAARKLDILADHNSPLLAVLAMTARNTSIPSAAAQTDGNFIQKGVSKMLAPLKKGETEAKAVVSAPTEAPDGPSSPADIALFFQPVDSVVPPDSPTWVNEKNQAYVDALAQLRHSMQDIASGGSTADPAVHQQAGQNYDKALDAVQQIAKGFKPLGVGGLDVTVERLLKEPIQLSSPFIMRNMERAGADAANGGLRSFCRDASKTLHKYPFQASSNEDASLDEFGGLFDPAKGAVWKFAQQSLGDFVVKDGSQWKAKDPSKKPQITLDMLGFLNRAQVFADVFYAGGSQPQFYYTLLPKLDSSFKEFTLELEIDGKPYQWTVPLQHQFRWPPPPGSVAVARLRTASNVGIGIASRPGTWGLFRIMGDAEPRELNGKLVEWKYTSSGAGLKVPISAGAVKLEIVGFPHGQDVFNPRFWEGLRCPSIAVQ